MVEAGNVCIDMCAIVPAGGIAGASKNNKIAEKISWRTYQLIFFMHFSTKLYFCPFKLFLHLDS